LDGLEADLEGEMDAAQLNYANSQEPELGINLPPKGMMVYGNRVLDMFPVGVGLAFFD
jgi:hypothetical protein